MTSASLAIGFDGIYLCDNNKGDDDLEYIRQIQAKFPQVEFINKRDMVYQQEEWFIEMYKKVGPSDWCLFIDIDEFLTFGEGMSLYRYMSLVRETPCQQIKINWMTFGNNKEIFFRPGSVRDRFPTPIATTAVVNKLVEDSFVKPYIIGGLQIRFPLMHYAKGKGLYSCTSDFKKVPGPRAFAPVMHKYVYIRHYKTLSEEEFCWKMLKWKDHPVYARFYNWRKRYNGVNKHEPNAPYTGMIKACNFSDAHKLMGIRK